MRSEAPWPAGSVERRAVSDLVPYARNSRTHSAAQVSQLAASIREFGWTTPVLIDEANTIIAGHGRVMAAQQLGIDSVPVHVCSDWNDAKRRAYTIADNRLALNAGWDMELLAVELDELRDLEFDMDLLGFEAAELNDLIGTPSVPPLDGMPALPSGDRAPFRQVTFTLHDEQYNELERALEASKALGPFDSPNENSNGNALARIVETFLTEHGQ